MSSSHFSSSSNSLEITWSFYTFWHVIDCNVMLILTGLVTCCCVLHEISNAKLLFHCCFKTWESAQLIKNQHKEQNKQSLCKHHLPTLQLTSSPEPVPWFRSWRRCCCQVRLTARWRCVATRPLQPSASTSPSASASGRNSSEELSVNLDPTRQCVKL